MSEIISLHLGTFGRNVAREFWNQTAQQQIINLNGQLRQNPEGRLLFFQQKKNGFYQARSIFCDMRSKVSQKGTSTDKYQLHNSNNILVTKQQSRGLFPQGKCCEGICEKQDIQSVIRKEVQKCDRLSGFLITNAVQGGTGSGLYALIIQQLRELYCDSLVQTHTLFPQLNESNSPLHIYNTVFSKLHTIQNTDFQILFDNESAIRMLRKQFSLKNDYTQINKAFGRSIVQQTSSYRFPGAINSNQRKLATNLILFPRIKFIYQSISEPNIGIKQMPLVSALNSRNQLFGQIYSRSNTFYTMSIHSRDKFSYEQQVGKTVASMMSKKNINPTQWIPSSYHISCCNNTSEKWGSTVSILTNSSSVVKPFSKAAQFFTKIFRRKAFIHYYLSYGMDQMEFTEAESQINDLISEYWPSQDPYYDEDQQMGQYDIQY